MELKHPVTESWVTDIISGDTISQMLLYLRDACSREGVQYTVCVHVMGELTTMCSSVLLLKASSKRLALSLRL